MNPATQPESFWSPAGSWEIVLFGGGFVLTLVVVAFFIIVMVRAGREDKESPK